MRRIIYLLALMAMLCINFLAAQSEPPEFPSTGTGPSFNLTAGANNFSGRVTSPGDTQDRFQITLAAGQTITSISASIATTNPPAQGSFSVGNSVASFPGGNISPVPSGAGTYQVIVSGDFAVGNNWAMTVNVTSGIDCSSLTGTTSKTNISCNGGSNGTATVNVSGGATPYTYSWSPSGGTSATASGLAAGQYKVTVTDSNACTIDRTVTITQPTALTAITSQVDVACESGTTGSATITVSGGTPGYTYLWSNGATTATITGIPADTYSVTATDANLCTISRIITVISNDTQSPVINCAANISVANDEGVCGAVVTYSIPTATDNCSFTIAQTDTSGLSSGSIFPIGTTTLEYTATDGTGNTDVCSFTVTVNDTEAPFIDCPANIEVSNDTGVCGAIVNYTVPFSDNCSATTITQTAGLASGSEFPVGTTINTFEVMDAAGNIASCSFEVTVNDTDAPIAVCQSIIVELDANGNASVTAEEVNDNSYDQGLTMNYGVVSTYFVLNDQGQGFGNNTGFVVSGQEPVYFDPATATDEKVRIGDEIFIKYQGADPTITDREITYRGNSNDPSDVTWEFSFPNNRFTLEQDAKDVGDAIDPYTFYAIKSIFDVNGSQQYLSIVEGDVTLTDFANRTLYKNQLVSGEFNECSPVTIDLDITDFNCTNVGDNAVTLTVTDGSGNIATCSTTVTVEDNLAPTAVCQNVSVELDENGSATVTADQVDGGSTDNCTIASVQFTQQGTAFAEVNEGQILTISLPVGQIITSVDFASYGTPNGSNGNYTIGSCNAANSQSIVEGYALGNNTFSIQADNSTFGDPCGGTPKRLYVAVSYISNISSISYDCSNIGSNDITLLVTDASGNTATCSATVTVVDTIAPVITCVPDATRDTDAGVCQYTVVGTELDASFTDNCINGSITNDLNGTATLAGEVLGKGDTTIVWTVDDGNGQTASCTTVITVEDNEAPVITCVADATRDTDAGVCQYTIVGTEFDATFTDNCADGTITNDLNGTATLAGEVLGKGDTTIVWNVDDGNGQTETCTTVITVEDNEAPVITCVADTTRDTDAGVCQYTIVGNEFDATFTDNCADGTITNNLNGTATLEGEILGKGDTTIVWTVDDGNGQTASCTTVITVEDNEAPVISCAMDIIANTDPGDCFATVSFANAVALDNCEIASIIQTGGDPSGSQFPVGVSTIEFTATDDSGNMTSCSFTITVTDNQAPVAVCQPITVQLDENGNASITAADIDGGSTDQCGVASLTIDIDTFDCSNVGENDVILTVTDVNGNTSTCTAVVTVEDVTAPVVSCQSIVVELDPTTGTVTIAATDIDNGSTDVCGIATYTLDVDTFDCANIGDNTVVLTVTDVNGNTASCTATVTVEDNSAPVLVCQDFTIEIGADGTATLEPSNVIASNDDVCGILTTAVDITEFSCADIGTPVMVQVFSQDNNGNISTCMATVTAVDVIAPEITCPINQTVDPGAENLFYTVPDYFATGEATVLDNCTDPVTITSQDPAPGTALPDGVYTVTFTATDASGNVGTCSFELTVTTVLGVGNNQQSLGTVTLYPVPTNAILNIGNPENLELQRLEIYDLRGRLVQKADLRGMGARKAIDVNQLSNATYMVKIIGTNGEITKRLLKE